MAKEWTNDDLIASVAAPQGIPPEHWAAVPQRARAVFYFMLTQSSQISELMRLTGKGRETVHQYTQEIYKSLGIKGKNEEKKVNLLKLCLGEVISEEQLAAANLEEIAASEAELDTLRGLFCRESGGDAAKPQTERGSATVKTHLLNISRKMGISERSGQNGNRSDGSFPEIFRRIATYGNPVLVGRTIYPADAVGHFDPTEVPSP